MEQVSFADLATPTDDSSPARALELSGLLAQFPCPLPLLPPFELELLLSSSMVFESSLVAVIETSVTDTLGSVRLRFPCETMAVTNAVATASLVLASEFDSFKS